MATLLTRGDNDTRGTAPLLEVKALFGRRRDRDLMLDEPPGSRLHAKTNEQVSGGVAVDLERRSGTRVHGELLARRSTCGGVTEVASTRME